MPVKINWPQAIKPLLKKYKGKRHPLEYKNVYQLIVMVILSAQDSDKNINKKAIEFFKLFPNMQALSKATPENLMRSISSVRNFRHKATWLLDMAQSIKKDKNIPATLDELTTLPGIGRKSANVILRESGKKPEGIIVDLHVVRVAQRLGIASGTDAKKIEKQIMDILPPSQWDAGMAMSFLGREICRPTDPKCEICVMNKSCKYYFENKKRLTKKNTNGNG
jgi:endonuclease-3